MELSWQNETHRITALSSALEMLSIKRAHSAAAIMLYATLDRGYENTRRNLCPQSGPPLGALPLELREMAEKWLVYS